MALNQTGRLIRMTKGPLGPDEVVMTGFSGREAMSGLFSFRLEFISTRLDLKPGEIIGKDVAIELDRRDNRGTPLTPRYFHGYINRFAAGNVVQSKNGQYKYRIYRAEMVPWLWFLTQTARCFLFFPEKEDKSIFEIIEAVFARAKSDLHVDPVNDLKGINDLKNRKVKHCVQYRETDFNFVSRTMERYGVFYYFKFEDGKHTLVVDMKKNYPNCEEAEVMYPRVMGTQSAEDHITDWQHDYEFVPGKSSYTDYNFEKPSTSLKADAPKLPTIDLAQNDKYEVYDYPGGYDVKGDGDKDARTSQEIEEVRHNIVNGGSVCRTFTPGHKFKLKNHPDEDAVSEQGKSYVLTSVQHTASQPTDDTRDSATDSYSNRFTCIPDSVQFRPERITPMPQISGVQTAVVVGPEEIHTDKYGRIKVQFHWDREGKKDGNSSCWIRVSQNWGGAKWGGVFIPHVGQEVIVDFEEGDPDRPIVTGRVYNADIMPPLALPANKTKSVIRDHGGNEIIMEGEKGKEQIRMYSPHSETSFTLGAPSSPEGACCKTKANYVVHADQDSTHTVGHDYDLKVLNNWSEFGKGWVHKNYIGLLTQLLLGGKVDNITPFERKHILGWTQASIVGFKREVIGGAQTSILGGKKNETIRGSTVKLHVGKATEYRNTALDEKTPSKRELSKVAKLMHKEASEIVEGQKMVKTAGEMYEKGNKMFMEAKTIAELKAGSKLRMEATDLKIEGNFQIAMCSSYSTEAGKYVVNNGAFAVK